MSERAGKMLREDIEALGPVRAARRGRGAGHHRAARQGTRRARPDRDQRRQGRGADLLMERPGIVDAILDLDLPPTGEHLFAEDFDLPPPPPEPEVDRADVQSPPNSTRRARKRWEAGHAAALAEAAAARSCGDPRNRSRASQPSLRQRARGRVGCGRRTAPRRSPACCWTVSAPRCPALVRAATAMPKSPR